MFTSITFYFCCLFPIQTGRQCGFLINIKNGETVELKILLKYVVICFTPSAIDKPTVNEPYFRKHGCFGVLW